MYNYTEISVAGAADLIKNADPLILDKRDVPSYQKEHIDGAMQAHGGLVEHLIKSQSFERPVLVYCYHGTSSKDLAEVFGRAGFRNSYSMRGGYTAWKKRHSLYSQTPYSENTNKWLERSGFEAQSLNAVIDGHMTPLMLACQEGKAEIVLELLEAGADLDQRNSDGNTALWAAAYGENSDIISLLINAGADLDHQNADGVSAMAYAASAGKTAVVRQLVSNGANPQLKTSDDFTALDLAANEDILKLLKPLTR